MRIYSKNKFEFPVGGAYRTGIQRRFNSIMSKDLNFYHCIEKPLVTGFIGSGPICITEQTNTLS